MELHYRIEFYVDNFISKRLLLPENEIMVCMRMSDNYDYVSRDGTIYICSNVILQPTIVGKLFLNKSAFAFSTMDECF